MKTRYRRIIGFYYKNEKYDMFVDKHNRLAFLKIDSNNNYTYPDMRELIEITHIFVSENNFNLLKKHKSRFFTFTPKVKVAGLLLALSIPFLTGCVNHNFFGFEPPKDFSPSSSTISTNKTDDNGFDFTFDFSDDITTTTDENAPYNGTGVPDNISDEVLEKYLSYLAPADDEYDFRYASDYQEYNLVNLKKAYDSSGYEKVFGYTDVSLEQIKSALQQNPNISQKYKDFVYQYAKDLRTLYPNLNLAVLHHNLSTLKIDEVTQEEMNRETVSMDSEACYIRQENRICVLKTIDLNKNSDGYIVLTHELSHAARGTSHRDSDGNEIRVGFYDYYRMGTYAEEGIITNISYQLQGLDKKSDYYALQSSYYRIIAKCIGYTPEDYFNHSVNYLIDRMDEFMGDDDYAFQIVAMIDAQASLRYTSYAEVDFHEFAPLYEYIAEMYFKKFISQDMTYDEAEIIFDEFYNDITYRLDTLKRKYDINEDTFRPTFEEYIEDLGIKSGLRY